MVEFQSRSGLPHEHGLAWSALTPAQRTLLATWQSLDPTDLCMATLQPLVDLAKAALTVTTCPEVLATQFPTMEGEQVEEVVGLARRLQVHRCTPSCTHLPGQGHGQQCKHHFPRHPSLLDLVARRPARGEEEWLEAVERVQLRVQGMLRQLEVGGQEEPVEALLHLLHQLGPAPAGLPGGGYSWCGVTVPPGEELTSLLQQCGAMAATQADTATLACYHLTLLTRRSPRFVPRRRVCEVWVATFNPWALLALQANMEIDLLASPSAVARYATKGSRQLSLVRAVAELRRRGGREDLVAARRLQVAVEAGHREVPLGEAFYRLDTRLFGIQPKLT